MDVAIDAEEVAETSRTTVADGIRAPTPPCFSTRTAAMVTTDSSRMRATTTLTMAGAVDLGDVIKYELNYK